MSRSRLRSFLRRGVRRALALWRRSRPGREVTRFGAMRRLRPVSEEWGYDRGQPIDRWYIDDFLGRFSMAHYYAAGDIRGRILEVGGDEYSSRAAARSGRGSISSIDVLHVSDENPKATIVGDLVTGAGVPKDAFDCLICTQTLHVVFDIHAAVRTIHQALRRGGVALVTVPGITRSCVPDRDHWGDYWRLTSSGAEQLFAQVFGADSVRVETYGNLRTAMGFLQGMAAEEFAPWELQVHDLDFEVLIGIRAQRASP